MATTIISDIKWKQTPEEEYEETKEYGEIEYPHFLGPMESAKKYTLKVTLKQSPVPVWRKFEVPSNITLRHLSELIMELMGWLNFHLNQFLIGDEYYLPFYQIDENYSGGDLVQEEYTVDDFLSEKGDKILFTYDFGDNWDHQVELSSVKEFAAGEPRIINFIKGTGDCPPEDCGGVWGYEDMLGILKKWQSGKRLSAEEKEKMEWAGWDKKHDPKSFDEEYCIEVCADFSE